MTKQTPLEELNNYLRMLADMNTVDVERKLFLLEQYTNMLKDRIK